MAGGWGKTSEKLSTEASEEEKQKVVKTFSPQDVAGIIKDAGEDIVASNVCCVFYGHDGTTKSGVCMDCRTPEEVKAGKQVIIIDLDGSASPLKVKYFKNDKNIKVIDPIEMLEDGNIDYISTYNKVLAIVRYIRENEANLNLAAVVLDGLNTLLKTCEYVMRYENLKVDPDVQIHDRWQWAIRNRRYLVPVILLKRLHCKRLFTTHLKELKQYVQGQLIHLDWVPDWEKSTPGIMFQRVLLERREIKDNVEFIATVKKAKGALHLEGKTYKVAEVTAGKTKWYGLSNLYTEFEKQV